MTDLRGISRGSKTAAVVILVVLLQVIVVSILGLGTITREREEGSRLARQDAERSAVGHATRGIEQASDGVLGALREAAAIARNPGGLRNLPHHQWYRAFRSFYRVDAEGRVRSSGGTRLYVPPDVVEAEEQHADRVRLEQTEKTLLSFAGRGDDVAMAARKGYALQFPYRTDGHGYASGVGQALQLAIDAAAAAAAGRTSAVPLQEAILLAYETAAINDHRPAAAQPGFAFVRARLQELVADPAQATFATLLSDLDRERADLEGFREFALPLAKEVASDAARARARVAPLGRADEIVALAPLPRREGDLRAEALLARVDRQEVALLVESPSVTDAGAPLRVVPHEDDRAAPASVRLPLQRPDFDPGLDVVAALPPVASAGAATGPRETFYWFILGLATLGVSIAGFVLVRILRREVHLARLKADFVSNLSHELKTPLTSISMFTEMLKDGRLCDADRQEAVGVIAQESERLQRIVSRMIDVARREAASTGYALVRGDLNAPVRAACERFRRLERDPALLLDVRLAADLPPMLLDAGAIDDAVTNLLANAWKYRKGDGAHVQVTTQRTGRRIELSVADDGIGISRHDRRRVFEMFFRADNYLSRNVPGTGLGLALVRTIVRVHRGRVRIEGAPGAGSTFVIRFPRARRTPRPAAGPAAPPPAVPTAKPGRAGAETTLERTHR